VIPAARRVALHIVAAAVVVAAGILLLNRPLAPTVPSADVHQFFDAEYLARARTYRAPRDLVRLALLVLAVAVPAWWALTLTGRRATARIIDWVGPTHPLRAAALVGLVVVVSIDVLSAPLVWLIGFVQDGNYGFRTQGAAGWWRDWLVVRAPGWIGVVLVIPVALWVIRKVPRAWPPLLGLAAGGLAALLTVAAPLILEPLWLRTTPLPSGEVTQEVLRVARAAGEDIDQVEVGDASRRTTKANAYVSGLGGTRRIVLFDTLLEQFSAREIGVVVAHELGHDRHDDIARNVANAAAGAVLSAYALAWFLKRRGFTAAPRETIHASAIPLVSLGLAVLMVVTLPLSAVISRRAEAAADWAALQVTNDPEGFAAMQVALAHSNLGDPDPPEWVRVLWYTHPTVVERLGLAQSRADMDLGQER